MHIALAFLAVAFVACSSSSSDRRPKQPDPDDLTLIAPPPECMLDLSAVAPSDLSSPALDLTTLPADFAHVGCIGAGSPCASSSDCCEQPNWSPYVALGSVCINVAGFPPSSACCWTAGVLCGNGKQACVNCGAGWDCGACQ